MECISPKTIVPKWKADRKLPAPPGAYQVPCGKCAFCLATRKADWSSRIHYEMMQHNSSSFVTLTYADAHLVFRSGIAQLHKRHLQLWFKRVRKAGYKFRYYAVGEYGSQTYRPHYHILIFGHVPEDVIRKCWDYGHVHIGKCSTKSIVYCLKYVIEHKGSGMRNGRVLPWATMSRRPGIGRNYLTEQMRRWHKPSPRFVDYRNYVIIEGEKRHLPRYWAERLFSKIDRVRIAVRDARAQIAQFRKFVRAHPRMRDPVSYLEDQKKIAARRIFAHSKKGLTI